MASTCLDDASFNNLLSRIHQETKSSNNKLKILYSSQGYFNGVQAAAILHAIAISDDKIKVIQMLESRLCRMSCQEARQVIEAVNIHNDRIIVLDCVKRVLTDCQTRLGEEYILGCFLYEHDKHRAMAILKTVHSDVYDKTPAGGHQGYAALGGLYTQSYPLVPHLYGDLPTQKLTLPGYGSIPMLPTVHANVTPSIYSSHPSYTFPKDKSYADVRGFPGHVSYPAKVEGEITYPGGAPPLGYHSSAPAPTGFLEMDSAGISY